MPAEQVPRRRVPRDADDESARAVSRTAYEGLFRDHYSGLVKLASLLVDDRGAAEEVVQEAFMRLFRDWDRLERLDAAPAYLRTTVVNLSRSRLRHRAVRRRHLPGPLDPEPAADLHVIARQADDTVYAAITKLPRRERECLVLRYYLDLSEADIAAALRISRGIGEVAHEAGVHRARRRARGRPVITETQVRDALHDAAAAVVVDEDLAWQRAWIEVARQPIRRVRRTSIALAAAAVVMVAVLAWQLFTRDDTSPSVNSVIPPAASEPAIPKTTFDQLVPGDTVAPNVWIAATDALGSARGGVAGSVVLNTFDKSAPLATDTARFGFAVDAQGRYRVDEATISSFALADGGTVQIDAARNKVNVDLSSTPRQAGALSNSRVDHLVHPSAWLQETLTNNPDLTIVYLGRAQQDGHGVLRFTVKFGSHVTFSDAGWDLAVDARTGVLLSAVVHYSSGTVDREVLTVEGFDDHAGPVLVESVTVPAGSTIAAAVDGTPVRGPVVPSGGETIAKLVAQVRAAAP